MDHRLKPYCCLIDKKVELDMIEFSTYLIVRFQYVSLIYDYETGEYRIGSG